MAVADERSRKLWRLVRRQHGVITRVQLRSLGYSDAEIEYRVATKRLHRVYRGVYAVGRPELGRLGRWIAAVLACGPRAALSHERRPRYGGSARTG